MALINETINCGNAVNRKNWGLGECREGRREVLKGSFVSLSPFSITADQLNNFDDWMDDNLHAALFGDRVQYFEGFYDVTNDDADPTTEEMADGSRIQTRDRKYRQMLRLKSDCLHRAIRSWNGAEVYVIDVDSAGGLDGVKGTLNGEQVISAAKISRLFAEDMTQATLANIAIYNVSREWANVEDLNLNHVHISSDKIKDGNGNTLSILSEAANLVVQEVTLTNTNTGTPASGIFDIAIHAGTCEESNLVRLFQGTIATAARWVVTNSAGGVIPPTAVAVSAAGDRIRFTLPTGNANYPASGGVLRFRQTSVQDWATAGMEWYDVQDDFSIVVP